MSCGEVCRCGLDPVLLWLWRRPAATAPIRPLAWEPLYAMGSALKKQTEKNYPWISCCDTVGERSSVATAVAQVTTLAWIQSLAQGTSICHKHGQKKKLASLSYMSHTSFLLLEAATFRLFCNFWSIYVHVFILLYFCFLGPQVWHMEGVKLELQLPAYTSATGLCHSHSNAGSEP